MRIFMQSISLITTLLINVSCAKRSNKAVESTVDISGVQAKRDLYIELANGMKDEFGWLPFECDALLHNSIAAYSGMDIPIYKAEEIPGKWNRVPDITKCVENSISRDMHRGLWLYLYKQKDLEAFKRIHGYAKANYYVMGTYRSDEEKWGRAFIGPMIPQLKDLIGVLTPPQLANGVVLSYNDEYGFVVLKRTFEAHLHALNIYLRAQMYGGITDYEQAVLVEYSKFQPHNALFSALAHKFTDGNFSQAVEILQRENLFPSTRLPNSSDRCTNYLFSKESNDDHDWYPCDEGMTHPGTDLMFTVKILEE